MMIISINYPFLSGINLVVPRGGANAVPYLIRSYRQRRHYQFCRENRELTVPGWSACADAIPRRVRPRRSKQDTCPLARK